MATAGMSFVFELLSAALGLIIFAAFRYCDPIEEGAIFTNDQVNFQLHCPISNYRVAIHIR